MGKKITEYPATLVTGAEDLVDVSFKVGGGYESRSTTFPYTKDASNNITARGELNIDKINEKTLLSGVKVQGSLLYRNGAAETKIKVGDVNTDNTNLANGHIQGRDTVNLFLESDTNNSTPNDNPNIYCSVAANSAAFKFCMTPLGDAVQLLAGHDGTKSSPRYEIKLGSTYTNPGTGVIPPLVNGIGNDFTVTTTSAVFGNTTYNFDRSLTVQSKKKSSFFVESDTDNNNVSEVPTIAMSSKGNRAAAKIELNSSGDLVISNGAVGTVKDIVISTGGLYASPPASGVIPTFTTPPVNAVKILGSNQIVDVLVGATFPTSGGTKSTLDYYEEYTHSTTFTNDTATTGSINIDMVRIGKSITFRFNSGASVSVPGAPTVSFTANTVLPARFRPPQSMCGWFRSISNGVLESGMIIISNTGSINIYRNADATTVYAGAGNIGFDQCSGSYTI